MFHIMNRILVFCILLFVQLIISGLSCQTIQIERNYVNSIIQSPTTNDFDRSDIVKKWSKFSREYVYPVLDIDTTKSELQFSQIIEVDSLSKKIIFERCEQWFVLSYFQVLYSNFEAGKMIATASANAAERSMGARIFPAASGFLPIDSIALAPIFPIAKAGPIDPIPIANPLASMVRSIAVFTASPSIIFFFYSQVDNDLLIFNVA